MREITTSRHLRNPDSPTQSTGWPGKSENSSKLSLIIAIVFNGRKTVAISHPQSILFSTYYYLSFSPSFQIIADNNDLITVFSEIF